MACAAATRAELLIEADSLGQKRQAQLTCGTPDALVQRKPGQLAHERATTARIRTRSHSMRVRQQATTTSAPAICSRTADEPGSSSSQSSTALDSA